MKTAQLLFIISSLFTLLRPLTAESQTENNTTSIIKINDDYVSIAQILNDDRGRGKADTISKYLKANNIVCVWVGSFGLSMNVLKKDESNALHFIIDKFGINYIDLDIIQIVDSVAKAELKKYSDSHPKMISDGQLSLKHYDRNSYTETTIEVPLKIFQINYKFNQHIGSEVLFPTFSVIINIDTKETKFII